MKTIKLIFLSLFPLMVISFASAQNSTLESPCELVMNDATNAPGWYYVKCKYIRSNADGTKTGNFANGYPYTEVNAGQGDKNHFTVSVIRIDKNQKTVATGTARTKWSDPPTYFSCTDLPSVSVNRTVESTWGITPLSISFDLKDTKPGGCTTAKISFATPICDTHVLAFNGTMIAKKNGKRE